MPDSCSAWRAAGYQGSGMHSIREYTKTATYRTAVQHGGLLAIRNPGCILYVNIPRLPHTGQLYNMVGCLLSGIRDVFYT